MRVLGHARSVALRREVLVGRLFGRLDLVTTIDAVLVAWSWFGSIQACLVIVSLIGHVENWLFAEQDANNRRVVAYLNQVLALRLCHERLELRCSKGINETGFRNNKKQDLGACKNRKLISLLHDSSLALGKCDVSARLVADELDLNLATLATALLVIIVVVVAS
jgi:hypothetical protein